ncbi:multiple coagulation factor deficiency protein 2 homolog [Belonocnema kinseyi]|uniref:multiple coagulation factor deficiency protein 2 homolog n=1 Tax=Belonocnema kinseyi TaxID=2817044 RepID=UPI00143D6251|nr:multiple coagulation factor deficiency protein 2 homolog [Belonocnema kinseyi]XP_033209157.1 multiple coagulation factor deficiency protein 2 homolog [Belonocnema kinseyi]
MLVWLLISFYSGVALGFRGPHHPRSSVSHHHYSPQKEVKLTQDAELLHDASHLKEDMGPLADKLDLSKLSDQELEFYYFTLHDVDNNTKLDGLEILHAIQHTLHEHDDEGDNKQLRDSQHKDGEDDLPWIVELIDRVLAEDDLDNDGYLGYIEYMLGRQRNPGDEASKDRRLNI